jgi:Domain of unknown function (DUF4157)
VQSRTTRTPERSDESAGQTFANNNAQEYQPSGQRHLFALSQAVGNRAVSELFKRNGDRSRVGQDVDRLNSGNGSIPTLKLQAKAASGASNTREEQEADRAAEEATRHPDGGKQATALIAEDDEEQLEAGQMRKSEFLEKLRASVCSAAEEALAGTIWSAAGCPFIDRWFSHYGGKSSQHIERALFKYAPEAAGVRTAREYIPIITERLRLGIEQWRETGEVTGVPEELAGGGMPGATAAGLIGGLASRALSAVGSAISGLVAGAGRAVSGAVRALFKERPGGASQPANITDVLSQLGSGDSLEGSARRQMESAFGSDFSSVRVHSDTKAEEVTGNMNARAVTVGRDIAFARGEYRPGTVVGDALLAHELAHVVQQGGTASAGAQTKSAASHGALEEEADIAAAGAVASTWGGVKAPRAGVPPRSRSGLQLQGCSSPKKAKMATKQMTEEEKAHARFRSDKLAARDKDIEKAGTLLREVGQWVATEQKKQQRPEITGVVGLDPKQLENAKQAAAKLKGKDKLYDAKGLNDVGTKLQEAVTTARGVRGLLTEQQAAENQMAPSRAADKLDEAVAALEKARDSVDGYDLWVAIEGARETLKSGDINRFAKEIGAVRQKMLDVQNAYARYPGAVARIQFVTQYFVAVNSPGFAGLPSADEIKKFRGTLAGSLGEDFTLVLGGGGVNSPFTFFIAYADILDKQLAMLDKMSAAGKAAKSPIPTQGEVEKFFETLKTKPNNEVRKAYEQYAQAYFYHRVVANIQDMSQKGVADLYKRDLSIAGTRPLVCSGYAILGADLIGNAGAKVVRFTTAVRATNDDLVNDAIDEGHAIVLLSRKGQQFFVSNDITVDKEQDAIGPDAVAWTKSTAPLHKATGSTNPEALANLKESLRKKIDALKAQKGGKAGKKP